MAETTTTTSFPARLLSTIRLATRKTPAASATDEPPNLATIKPIVPKSKGDFDFENHRPNCEITKSLRDLLGAGLQKLGRE
ncbi:unannotated protein [freshwater metagenome]|uniref:Unannotated protein n=1 Tax=freshwater metagenome TaxID=449393 RepID=A0A6J6UC47_9ZZZZ